MFADFKVKFVYFTIIFIGVVHGVINIRQNNRIIPKYFFFKATN